MKMRLFKLQNSEKAKVRGRINNNNNERQWIEMQVQMQKMLLTLTLVCLYSDGCDIEMIHDARDRCPILCIMAY